MNGIAQSIPSKDDAYLNDFAKVFSRSDRKDLRKDIVKMCDYYSTQIVVCTVNSFYGYPAEEYASELGEEWGVTSNNANGLLVLIKPKSDYEKGEVIILPSSDLRNAFTRTVCDELVQNQLIPYFKEDDYYRGVESLLCYLNDMPDDATSADNLASEEDSVTSGKSKQDDSESGDSSKKDFSWLKWFLVIIVAVVAIIFISSSKKSKRSTARIKMLKTNGDIEDILAAMQEFDTTSDEYIELKAKAKQSGATERQLKTAEIMSKYNQCDDDSQSYLLGQMSNSKTDEDFMFWADLARSVDLNDNYIRLAELSRLKKTKSANVDTEVAAILKFDNDESSMVAISLGLFSPKVEKTLDTKMRDNRIEEKKALNEIMKMVNETKNVIKNDAKKEKKPLRNIGKVAALAGGVVMAKRLIDKKKQKEEDKKDDASPKPKLGSGPRFGANLGNRPKPGSGNASKGEW